MSSTSLYLPKLPWFTSLLLEVNKTESISSHLFKLAAEDLYSRKLIKKEIYLEAKEQFSKMHKPRKALLTGKYSVCKIYIKDAFKPLLDSLDDQGLNRTAYFWGLLVKNSKLTKAQVDEFKILYPEFKE